MKLFNLLGIALLVFATSHIDAFADDNTSTNVGIENCREQIKKGINPKDIDPDKYYETVIRDNAQGQPRIMVLMDDKSNGITIYIATPDCLTKAFTQDDMGVDYLGEPTVVDFKDCSVIVYGFGYGGSSIPGSTLILEGDNLIDTGMIHIVTAAGGRNFDLECEDYMYSCDGVDGIWCGHCYYFYYPFYFDENKHKFVEYPAHNITKESAANLIDLEPVNNEAKKHDACPTNYILRDNGDLNINFISADKDGIINYHAVARIIDGKLQWVTNEFGTILTEGRMHLHYPGDLYPILEVNEPVEDYYEFY